ncbi:MAG: cupin domain-containing protein [Deltaproteobacteria bacterium]|nr:cupin domain-containing protein [Deltaproteobacteria bacterium]
MTRSLPEEIKTNPEIDVSIDGIRGWKVGGSESLVVFFEIQPGTVLPEHSHCFQWGFILDGAIELTIGGETRIHRKGDSYTIPEGAVHSGRIPEGALAMDYFADPKRY